MKRILKYFGYIHIMDLVNAAKDFDDKQTEKRNELCDEAVSLKNCPEQAANKFMDGLEESWQSIGAMKFVTNYLKEWKNY